MYPKWEICQLSSTAPKLKKVTSATGQARFIAESDSQGHADRTWACFLALLAAEESVLVPSKASSRRERASRTLTKGY